MDYNALLVAAGVYAATFVICFTGGVVPLVNSEIYLASLVYLFPASNFFFILFLAVVAQMIAKGLVYLAGMGIITLPFKRYRKTEAILARADRLRKKPDLVVFISSLSGFPPFYIISFLGGILKIHFIRFIVAGTIGMLIRFSVLLFGVTLLLKN